MNIIEAIEKNKTHRVRQVSDCVEGKYHIFKVNEIRDKTIPFYSDNVLAEWEVVEEKITITELQLEKAIDDYVLNFNAFYPLIEETRTFSPRQAFKKALGFK